MEDPEPIKGMNSEEEKKEYKKMIQDYGIELLDTFKRTDMVRKEVWRELITSFRPHKIQTCGRSILINWTQFFMSRQVHVYKGRRASKEQNLIELLFKDNHIDSKPNPLQKSMFYWSLDI